MLENCYIGLIKSISGTQLNIKITANGETHVGQVRSNNQDSFLVKDLEKLYIVADGMGVMPEEKSLAKFVWMKLPVT